MALAARSTPALDVRRAAERFVTRTDWLTSYHSFSFDSHYDPANTHHGLLLANNDDVVQAGAGFDTHAHRDAEIVTWVLEGSLVHEDSTGHRGVIYPGLAQRMSAGRGIWHSERNDAWRLDGSPRHDEPVHFVQMWVSPDESGRPPGYEQRQLLHTDLRAAFVPVASGRPGHEAAIRIHNRYATLHAARVEPTEHVTLPHAAYVHLFVARGSVTLEGAVGLGQGDAVRLTGDGGQRIVATAAAELLVWEMHAALGG